MVELRIQPWKLLMNYAKKIQKQCDYNDGANDAQSAPCAPSRIAVIATATTKEQKQNDKQNQHSILLNLFALRTIAPVRKEYCTENAGCLPVMHGSEAIECWQTVQSLLEGMSILRIELTLATYFEPHSKLG